MADDDGGDDAGDSENNEDAGCVDQYTETKLTNLDLQKNKAAGAVISYVNLVMQQISRQFGL